MSGGSREEAQGCAGSAARRRAGRPSPARRARRRNHARARPRCPAERMADDNRRALVCAGLARRLARLADELAEIIGSPSDVPCRRTTARQHAARGRRTGDEAPPVAVRGAAVQNRRPGLPRSPQASVSTFAPSTATKHRSGSITTARSNQPAQGAFVRERPRAAPWGSFSHEPNALQAFRRLRTAPPRPCRRRRTSSRRHSARRGACPRSARGRPCARRSCHRDGRWRSRRRRR